MTALDIFINGFAFLMILRYPSYFYDASTSKMILQCILNPVHEGVVTIFGEGFLSARSTSARRRKDISCNWRRLQYISWFLSRPQKNNRSRC